MIVQESWLMMIDDAMIWYLYLTMYGRANPEGLDSKTDLPIVDAHCAFSLLGEMIRKGVLIELLEMAMSWYVCGLSFGFGSLVAGTGG